MVKTHLYLRQIRESIVHQVVLLTDLTVTLFLKPLFVRDVIKYLQAISGKFGNTVRKNVIKKQNRVGIQDLLNKHLIS